MVSVPYQERDDPLRYDLAYVETRKINREIDIQFTKLDSSMMFYYYGRGSANTRPPALNILPNGVTASLLLYWAEVPVSTSIPRSLDLQTWNVREFQDVTNGGAVSANLTAREDRSSLIQLNSVPSIILTHLERDKDNPDYQPVALASQSNLISAVAANQRQGGAIHNWDNYGEVNTITYLLGDRPRIWGLWYLNVLLICLVQGITLEHLIPLIYRNIYNSIGENSMSWL